MKQFYLPILMKCQNRFLLSHLIWRKQFFLLKSNCALIMGDYTRANDYFFAYQNINLNPRILSAIRNFYRMLLNPPNPLKTQGFKQVNNSIPVIQSCPLLRASRELARETDMGFWNVKDKASVGCRDVTSQQTCTLYQPKTSYKTGKRTSEDARFFRSLEVRYFEQPQHIPSQAAGQTAQGEGGSCPNTPAPGRDGCPHPPDGTAPIS